MTPWTSTPNRRQRHDNSVDRRKIGGAAPPRLSKFMTRTFWHAFHPPHMSTLRGQNVELTVQEIEDACLREILQTPGAALGSWAMVDALLQPTGDDTPFVFRQPLGEAPEVKVALSGLFGRFVARAYLARYFGLSICAHLGRSTIDLDGRRQIEVLSCKTGDLPDWVACAFTLRDLTVAEAKGSHAQSGPAQALGRAWKQAGRIRVEASGHPMPLRRIAIATRWGVGMRGRLIPGPLYGTLSTRATRSSRAKRMRCMWACSAITLRT